MAKKSLEFQGEVTVVKFETISNTPVCQVSKTGQFIRWGKNNLRPTDLINLYKGHPEHKAIVDGKASYMSGTEIKSGDENVFAGTFLSRINQFENAYSLSKKVKHDKAVFGGYVILITANILGKPISAYHLPMGKIRISSDLSGVWVSSKWKDSNLRPTDAVYYPFYSQGHVGESVYFYKRHTPSIEEYDSIYPEPDYSSVVMDIDTDIEISNFFNALVKNGFSAGTIITFFNGKLTPEQKADVEKRLYSKHAGTSNAGKIVISYTNPDGKAAEITNITPNGLAEQYEPLNKRNQQKIITGHNVPGVLFKIKTEGQLGDRNELDIAHELFINEFAKVEQVDFNLFLKEFLKDKSNVDADFSVVQVEPIGKVLPLDNQNVINALNARDPNIVTNYIIKHYGLELATAEIADPTTSVEASTNDSLKNLTGKQRQALDSITRKFMKGVLTEQQAILQLMPFGFTEENAKLYLGIEANILKVQQAKQDKFFDWVKMNVIEIDESDDIIDESPINFKLADKKPEKKKGFIAGIIDTFKSKVKKEDYETEVYTVYKYGLRPELKGEPLLLDTSHEFCREMVAATSGNKRLTFEAIDSLENDSEGDNTNAWDYRGGFWGKKNSCRHIWIGETRVKKIKK